MDIRINLTPILYLLAGYCFYGMTGLGVAASIIILIAFLSE